MNRRFRTAALTTLAGLLLTGMIAAQNAIPLSISPETTLAPEITLEPEATAEFDPSSATVIEGGGISFLLPAEVAAGATMTEEPADPVDLTIPPGGLAPAHTRFDFVDYAPAMADNAPPVMAAPELLVFKTADFPPYTFGEVSTTSFPSELAELQRLLETRPSLANEDQLPVLPLVAGSQMFHAREYYIDFANGSGIFYLTLNALSVDPLMEGQIVAVFQGVSDDGETYISAAFPLDTGILFDVLPDNFDMEAFERGYQDVLASTRAALNEWPGGSMTPPLGALRAMFGSITVTE